MKSPDNSILQRSFRLAEELKVFDIKDLMIKLPNAKKETLKRYLQAMVKNGNIMKDEETQDFYIFISNKPIKTKIGG